MQSNSRCTKCGKTKTANEFGVRYRILVSGKKSGPFLESWCLPCKRIYNGRSGPRRSVRKQKLIAMHGGKCVKCHGIFHHAAYDFHHRDPSQKHFHLTALYDKKWDRLVAEAAKCDLICSNCHRVMHYEEGIIVFPSKATTMLASRRKARLNYQQDQANYRNNRE